MSKIISYQKLIPVAALDATHWWVFREHAFHKLFSNGNKSYVTDMNNYEKAFLDFSNTYSVFKFVKSEVRCEILAKLIDSKFHENVLSGDTTCLEEFVALTKTSTKKGEMQRHLSMLSKYATLINPSAFTMLDRNAVSSLFQISYLEDWKCTKKDLGSDYQVFIKVFNSVKLKLKKDGLGQYIKPHIEYLQSQFSDFPIDQDVFENRVVDKFLWHLHNAN